MRFWIPFSLMVLLACGHHRTSARVHFVVHGDTLSAIAKKYDTNTEALILRNHLVSADTLSIGQRLVIPGPEEIFAPVVDVVDAIRKIELPKSVPPDTAKAPRWAKTEGSPKFIWPVDGVVTALFGPREGVKQDGLTIAARLNMVVWASAAGKVVYAGEQSGYGLIVILKHANDFVSIYAHNESNLVKEGDVVQQGQPIARAGQSGGATAPGVHFELRHGQKALNPLRYLP